MQVQKQNQCLLKFVLIFNQMWLSQVLLMTESEVIVVMNSWELGAVSERKLPAVIGTFLEIVLEQASILRQYWHFTFFSLAY